LNLLLDTHVFVWWWQGSRSLKGKAREAIATAAGVYVSSASAWEMAIKVGLGKLRFEGSFSAAVEKSEFTPLPIEFAHAEGYRALPPHHPDPFDRMLAAQALVEKLTLVTHDRRLEAYSIPILWA
jgi:PIN domain nuclease of toxin-antitoxin system